MEIGGRCARLAVQVAVGGLPVHAARLPYQRTMFRWMLRSVNTLYLGGSGPHPHGQRPTCPSFGRSSRPGWRCSGAQRRGLDLLRTGPAG